ncbi:MAG: hypothetical protein ACE5JP_13400 [Candidatus Bipolaricaulia bacterium]
MLVFTNAQEKAAILPSALKRECQAILKAQGKTEKTAKWMILSVRDDIRFISIGRQHRAHQLAYGIFTGRIKPKEDIRIHSRQIIPLLK